VGTYIASDTLGNPNTIGEKMAKLIDSQGTPRFGLFESPVDHINVENYIHRTPFGKKASGFKQWGGFKRFQYYGVLSDKLILGVAMADLKHTGAIFLYVYLPESGEIFEKTFRTPFAFGLNMTNSPTEGETVFTSGQNSIRMQYRKNGEDFEKSLTVNLASGLKVQSSLNEPAGYEYMNLCTRIGMNGWVYAQKTAGLPVTGTVESSLGNFNLEEINAYGHHDFSAGYMRRETFWNWACLSGKTEAGDEIGLNISCGVNETSWHENCFWLNGKLVNTSQSVFEYNERDLRDPWHIYTHDGKVDLDFIYQGAHRERLNAGFVATNFSQLFGRFEGTIKHDNTAMDIRGMPGFVEEQYAKW